MRTHKNCWFWLLTTIVGMCVVNFHRLYFNSIKIGSTSIQECNAGKFSDFIFHTLFLQDINRQTNRDLTDKQKIKYKTRGNPITNNWCVRRKYLQRNGMNQYNIAQWWYKLWNFPLCTVNCSKTSNNKAKSMSCLVEHLSTYDHKNYIYGRAGEYSRGNFSHYYYNLHLYLKIIIVIMMKMNTLIWNQM